MSNSGDFEIKKGSTGDSNAVLLVKYTGNEEHVTVPDCVTEIGWQAFTEDGNLKSVSLPDSIQYLDPRAFPNWGKTLADENGLCIAGKFLINYTGTASTLIIPEGITRICFSVADGNRSIHKVVFPSTIEVIGNQSFARCKSLEEVEFAGGGVHLKTIEFGAFSGCANLERINMPEQHIELREDAFDGCDKLSDDPDFIIVGTALSRCKQDIETVVVPDGIKSIGDSAFKGHISIKHVILPEGIEVIGKNAFFMLKNLETVNFPASLKNIDDQAFDGCSNLQRADLKNVIRIGSSAFSLCGHLKVSLPETLEVIEGGAFDYCTSIDEITLPARLKKLGYGIVDDRMTRGTFANVPIKHVVIPTTLNQLDSRTFMFTKLEDVIIPGNIKVIGSSAFSGCKNLKTVRIEEGVEEIKSEAFLGCEQLTSIIFPNSLKAIGKDAFRMCPQLKGITLPASITDGMTANEKNEYFSTIGIPDENGCVISGGILMRYDGLPGTVRISDGVEIIPKNVLDRLFGYRVTPKTKEIILPNSVKVIEEQAFGRGLEMNIPEGYLQQKTKLPKKSTEVLLSSIWQDKATVRDYVYVLFVQGGKDLKSICTDRLSRDCEETLTVMNEVLDEEPKKGYFTEAAEFILENIQKIRTEDITSLYNKAKAAKATAAAKLLAPYSADVEVKKERVNEGEAPSDVVMCALVPYMQQLDEKPRNIGSYKWYHPYFTIDKNADRVASALDRESLEKTLDSLIGSDLPNTTETLVPFGRFASGKQISNLISRMKRWGQWYSYGVKGRISIMVARGAILLNDSREAVLYADKNNLLNTYAKLRKTDADTLRDKVLADFGLDGNGKKTFDLGGNAIEVSVNQDLTFSLYDTKAEKIVKSIPKRGADEKKYESAKTEFADMKKNLKAVIKGRNEMLFDQFLSGKTTKAPVWMDAYLSNYVLHRVAELIVWKQKRDTFILTQNGAIDCYGNEYFISETSPIGVAHPVDMDPDTIKAWQEYFTKNSLKQPFEQIWEPVIDQSTFKQDRFKGCMIPYYRFVNQEKHGINVNDYDFHNEIDINFDEVSATIERIDWARHQISMNDRFEVRSVSLPKGVSRRANHIISYLDRITMYDRIKKDDTSIGVLLERYTLAQIMDFIKIASENKCDNVMAILLNYKNENFSEFNPMDAFTLD